MPDDICMDAAAEKVLSWISSGFDTFDPFAPPAEDGPWRAAPIEKIWAECAMLYWICLGQGYGGSAARRAARNLAEPVKSPYFVHRASRERARFGACIHTLALAKELGFDVARESRFIERLIAGGGFWSPDLEGWETGEVAFSRALLGAEIAHCDVRAGLRRSILFQPERNICFVDRTEGYKLTHAVFYDTGFGVPGLYQGAPQAGFEAPPGVAEALDAVCGKMLLQGQFDLALELVLSALLYDLELTGVQLQVVVIALSCIERLGYVPPLIFEAARGSGEEKAVETDDAVFSRNYHSSLVFVLIAALCHSRSRTEAIEQTLSEGCAQSDAAIADLLPEVGAPRIAAANGGLAVGEMFNAADRYDLQKAALLLPALRRAGAIAPAGRVERSLQDFLRLQQRPDGGYGWFDVESITHGPAFKSVREKVDQAVAGAL